MTGSFDSKTEQRSIYTNKVLEWTNREIQLNRLHEEILAKRESLLSFSIHYLQRQHARNSHTSSDIQAAERRNNKFLQDIISTQNTLQQEAANPPSPRLTTLLVNYWSMVRSMKPLWEKSLDNASRDLQSKPSQSTGFKDTKATISSSKPEKKKAEKKKRKWRK